LRLAVDFIPDDAGFRSELTRRVTNLRDRLEKEGGSLRLSRAPRELVREVGAWGRPGPEISLMRGLKAEFDPGGILVPGRLGV